jgi:hypothetical protein
MSNQNWIGHALRQTGWRPQRQVIALATLGFFIALILGGLYLSQVVSDATTNRRLRELLEQRDDLERVNEQLRADIADLKSIPRLQSRAVELGFQQVTPGEIQYLLVEGYQPQTADTVAPIVLGEQNEEIYDETFTEWLSRQIENLQDWWERR